MEDSSAEDELAEDEASEEETSLFEDETLDEPSSEEDPEDEEKLLNGLHEERAMVPTIPRRLKRLRAPFERCFIMPMHLAWSD